ncbi:MAG: hypothetical protein K0S47_1463 [Herbinix sp.]|jgi:hypothetical protein|nr:hypothetical protein [Herbinix sp.]
MSLKKSMLGATIAIAIISQTACTNKSEDASVSSNASQVSQEQNTPTTKPEITQEAPADTESNGSNIDDSTLVADFDTLVAKEDISAKEILVFLNNNITTITPEHASEMIVTLEEVQLAYKSGLEEKFLPEEIQKSFYEAEQVGDDIRNPEGVKDEALKALLLEMKENGFKLEQAEGFYYPVMDYAVYKNYETNVTADMKAYITIMSVESDQVFAKDGGMIIGWDEVVNRALSAEEFINTYGDSVKASDVKIIYNRYEYLTLFGTNNTPIFDYENKTLNDEAKAAYEDALKEGNNSKYLTMLKEFMELVTANESKMTEDVEAFRTNIANLQVQDMNRYAVAGIDDPSEFETTFHVLQELIANDKKAEIAEYIAYPISITIDGEKVEIKNEEDFLVNYDKIMTEAVKKAFLDQKVEETFVNYQGVSVGSGVIWISQIPDQKQKYSIYGINN